jgi:hypothetical protein
LTYHRTFHTQQSSTYGKQGVYIYISISIMYSMRSNQKIYKLIMVHYSTDKN